MGTTITKSSGGTVDVTVEALGAFRASLRGDLLTPSSPGYDEARKLWNATVDRRPALVARCAGQSDVMRSVKFASEHELLLGVRGAGHNIAGKGTCEGGLLIDLSPMTAVHVDAAKKVARVQPGATLRAVDDEAQAFGLATPLGINSTTGISGLTLGGGFGWLSRKHGLTIDNLRSAEIVTADGNVLTASASENADLFWGLRGGGGNFGVVTSFEFGLHSVGPMVLSGLIVHPASEGRKVLRHYRDFVANTSEDLNVWVVLRKAPPLPFLPTEAHGTDVVIFACFHAGDLAQGERELAPFRAFGKPLADVVGPTPYAGWQQAFDPLLAAGARNYWKSNNFSRLSDELIDLSLEYASRVPSDQTEILIGRLGGAVSRVAADATAYPHREPEFFSNVHTRWDDPSNDAACIDWARAFAAATAPHATGGVYVNFVPDGDAALAAAYGPNYDRLVQVKRKYDPKNLFRVNHNIVP